MKPSYKFRAIEPEDNQSMTKIIVSSLDKFRITGPGCTSEDPELKDLYSTYNAKGSKYCVLINEADKKLFGGGGYSKLKGTKEKDKICEVQKFYFIKEARGLGLGKKLLNCVLRQAKGDGYKEAYLETHYLMERAVNLYKKFGFKVLTTPKGNTGHHARTLCMSMEL